MFTFALFNLKGGVGKTASCVNFAYLAAKDGYKTLLWDIDPQGATSFYYKVKPKQKVVMRDLVGKDASLLESVMATEYENLDIIPADVTAKAHDVMIGEMQGSKKRLATILKQLKNEYDFIFIDCPPGLSSLAENIFNAADIVLMPIIPTTLSVRTYHMVKDFFKEKEIDAMEEALPPMTHFVLPGGHTTVSYCHIARCVCRRAERLAVHLDHNEPVAEIAIKYLNRLSDYLFVLARKLSYDLNAEEVKWIPRK